MLITESKLRKIIAEEYAEMMKEAEPPTIIPSAYEDPQSEPGGRGMTPNPAGIKGLINGKRVVVPLGKEGDVYSFMSAGKEIFKATRTGGVTARGLAYVNFEKNDGKKFSISTKANLTSKVGIDQIINTSK